MLQLYSVCFALELVVPRGLHVSLLLALLFQQYFWPNCKPEGPLFSAEFVCLSVCLWPALLPFSIDRFWWNLVTRTLLWSSLAVTIMVHIGRRGTARRLFENLKKFSKKSQNLNFKILVHHFLRLCLLCIVKKIRLDSNKTEIHFEVCPCRHNASMDATPPFNAMRLPVLRCKHQCAAACP